MKFSILFVLFIFSNCENSQSLKKPISERDASFPGGESAMARFINSEVQYPQAALDNSEQGRVYTTFVVEKDGSITNIDVEDGGLSPALNDEATRLIYRMPKWIPGMVNGKLTSARCRLPITFTIDGMPKRKIRRHKKRIK